MKDIYKQAKTVTVYVGEDTDDIPSALSLLGLLFGASKHPNCREAETMITTGYWKANDPSVPPSYSPEWDALQNFYRREYFSRIWVVQEVALASSDPIVLLGARTLSWESIYASTSFYHSSGLRRSRPTADQSFNILLMGECRIQNLKRISGLEMSLLGLLRNTRSFRSTDPRDKIFALYGLANDILDDDGTCLFEPDYSFSVTEVYQSIAIKLIVGRGIMEVLSYVGGSASEKYPELPSWAPCWDMIPKVDILDTGFDDLNYSASFSFSGQAQLSSSNLILEVRGVLFDAIASVSPPVNQQFDMLPEFRNPGVLPRIWHDIVRPLGSNYMTGGTTIDAFWRTLIANIDINREAVLDEYYIHFLAYWRLARLSDFRTTQHLGKYPTRPSLDDANALRDAMEKDLLASFTNPEQAAAIKRRLLKQLADDGINCMNSDQQTEANMGSIFNQLINNFDMIRTVVPALDPLRGDDPSINMMDDEFIADWYQRLNDDNEHPISILDASANTYATCLPHAADGRAFLVTEGKIIGIGPAETRLGDRVAIIAGAQMPFIVRPRSDVWADKNLSYALIGEAYIHGVMDGSFVRVDEFGNPQWDILRLA